MQHKLADPIRNSDIAKAVGMSTTGLHDVFLKCLATTPHAKLVALRLDAAERLLCDPRLSIAEVAVRSGHSDQSTLTRIMQIALVDGNTAISKLLDKLRIRDRLDHVNTIKPEALMIDYEALSLMLS
jgi:AraC-like DNA-binding protein